MSFRLIKLKQSSRQFFVTNEQYFQLLALQQTPVIYFISFATGISSFSKVKYIYLPCFSLLGLFEREGKHQD